MRASLVACDWTQTPLGPLDQWPQALQILVNVMLDSGQPMFTAWGADRTLIYNDPYVALLGSKHPGALGKPFLAVWREAATDIQPLVDRVFQGESIVMDDIRLRLDRDLGPANAHFAFSYTPVRALSGEVEGLFCVCQETTRAVISKQLEERHKTRLAQMFEEAPSFIALLEGPEHRFTLTNARYQQLVGNRPLIGRSVAEALPDAVAQGYLALLDSVFSSGKPLSIKGAKYSAQPATGAAIAERSLDFVYQPITDEAGDVIGIFVEGTDVTERALAEEAVMRSEALLRETNASLEASVAERTAQLFAREALIRTFYQHSSECHAVLEQAGETFIYREINPATLRLYGKTRDQVIGHSTEAVLGVEPSSILNDELHRCLQHDGPLTHAL